MIIVGFNIIGLFVIVPLNIILKRKLRSEGRNASSLLKSLSGIVQSIHESIYFYLMVYLFQDSFLTMLFVSLLSLQQVNHFKITLAELLS